MAGIVTAHLRKNGPGCDHRSVTVALDGQSFTFDVGEGTLDAQPWDDDAKRAFVLLGLRRLRALGLALDNSPGRVTNGEEGSNIRAYNLVAPGSAVALTNVGTAYVNVLPGANGQRSLVDFTGCTQFRVVLTANLVGTGPFGVRFVRDSDSVALYENAAVAQTGERELDTDWQTVPAGFSDLTLLRLQMKSAVAADDPVVRRCVVLTR